MKSTLETKFPDTPSGAKRAFNLLLSTLMRSQFEGAKFFSDPATPGVWAIDSPHRRVVIYLAGYVDPITSIIRKKNDFEVRDKI